MTTKEEKQQRIATPYEVAEIRAIMSERDVSWCVACQIAQSTGKIRSE